MMHLVLLVTFLSFSFAERLSMVDHASHIKFPAPYYARNDGHLVGHLEPLGRQIPPLGQVPEYFEIPSPRELWEKNVKTYRPAILRGALLGSPAMEKWDDEYLTREYGKDEVYIEPKSENRNMDTKRMTIEGFLLGYKKYKWYVVSVLPDSMRKDIRVPKPLVCSSFLENLQELNLWIGANGTRSILHRDADNIMHCVVTGRKDWMLIHPDHESKLDMVPSRMAQNSGYSHLPVDAIDETINPEVWDVPWEYATLRAGDCLYLPPLYLHQVRSYNHSISATFLYFPRNHFVDDDCKNVDLDKYVSLDDVDVHWTYMTGQDSIDMGYPNLHGIRDSFLYRMDITGMKWVNFKYYLYISAEHRETFLESDRKVEFYKIFDANKDGIITRKEFGDASLYAWKELSRIGHPAGRGDDEGDEVTNRTSEFAPKPNNPNTEENIARQFLEFLIRVKGKNGSISFLTFKEWVVVKGDIATDFNYIDLDFDGFITKKELQEVNLKRLRQFSRMSYALRGTGIHGGGRYKEEVEGEDLTFLSDLDNIPDELMETESEEDSRQIELDNQIDYFKSIRALVEKQTDQKLTFEPFKKFQQEIDAESDQTKDYKFMFHVLDSGQKGYVLTEDVNKYIENLTLPPPPPPANADIANVKKERLFDRESIIEIWNSLMKGMREANEMMDAIKLRKELIKKKKAEIARKEKETPTGETITKKEEL